MEIYNKGVNYLKETWELLNPKLAIRNANYLNFNMEEVIDNWKEEQVFGTEIRRLAELKKKFDPTNFFKKSQKNISPN